MNEKVIAKLAENYCNLERTLIEELKIDEQSDVSSAEEIWQPVFQRIVPTKYNVEKNVYIIDSHKEFSQKVSLAIYDEQYTPYIFNYGTIKYIPIEAVAGVVLCENENSRKLIQKEEKKETWLQSIQKLKTEMNAYVRIHSGILDINVDSLYKKFICDRERYEKQKGKCTEPNCKIREPQTQNRTSTRPVTILCTTAVEEHLEKNEFDIILSVQDEKLKKQIPKEKDSLDDWNKCLNHYRLERYGDEKIKLKTLAGIDNSEKNKTSERTLESLNVMKDNDQNVLLSLMFQLNQLLMLINNPIFFPHQSYVKAFNEVNNDGRVE
ncbi:DUF6602 domain-containing protein [Virgibacillus proomii]|uniref:DUF6602 domain-containing protein n=1 Tax=Virgibacillus proomii TaxID=84407 RepID=UPI001C0F5DDF|nr:DUF6602 domain-containing protein [Virgibacillus proomii]MBU5266434.1 hypothetical protein [Virgibacillus proomii]